MGDTNTENINISTTNEALDSVDLMNGGLFAGLVIFYSATIGYYFVEKKMTGSENLPEKKTKLRLTLLAGYVLLTTTILFIINSITLYNKCGESQIFTAFGYTYLPWVIMFGSLCLILEVMPIFKMPFSNTIGYIIYDNKKTMELLENIFKKDDRNSNDAKIIMKFKKNPTLILNEIINDNFDRFIDDITNLIKEEVLDTWKKSKKNDSEEQPDSSSQDISKISGGADSEHASEDASEAAVNVGLDESEESDADKNYIKELNDVVIDKEKIATIIWYLLAGTLVSTYSSNIISTAECDITYKQLKKNKEMEESYN